MSYLNQPFLIWKEEVFQNYSLFFFGGGGVGRGGKAYYADSRLLKTIKKTCFSHSGYK